MLKETYAGLIKKALKMEQAGKGGTYAANPAVSFTRRAKAGDFDRWPNPEYNQSLDDVADVSKRIWKDKTEESWDSILHNLLDIADPSCVSHSINYAAVRMSSTFQDNHYSLRYDPAEDKIITGDEMENGGEYHPDSCTRHEMPSVPSVSTPMSIYQYLCGHVYGQDEAKKTAASLIWNHTRHIRRNVVFAGPTGCGKTEIWRQASKIYPHIRILDASRVTGDGWSGSSKVRNFFDGLTPREAEHTIYVLDEADKMFEPTVGRGGMNYSFVVQNELLRLLDGDEVYYPESKKDHLEELRLRTDGMSFVFLGSFEEMLKNKNASRKNSVGFGAAVESCDEVDYTSRFTPDDLVEYAGVRREIAGRIHAIVQLQPMTAEDYVRILHDPAMSPARKLSEQYGIEVSIDEETEQRLAEEAAASGMGVRFMGARLSQMLDEKLFEGCDAEEVVLEC